MGRGRPHKCPYCEATKSVAKGFRYNKGGKVRLRRCKACGRRWTTGLAPDEQLPEENGQEQSPLEMAPPAEENSGALPDEAAQEVENERETAESEGEDGQEPERRTELSLSGEGSPSQDDSGGEGKEESEETFFAQ